MIDPIQLADKGARLTGELSIEGMRRLVEMCLDGQGAVNVDLQFERNSNDGLHVMYGRIDARVALICQRCMGRLDYEFTTKPRLFLLKPGEREDLLEAGDAMVFDQPVMLGLLIEDELLLDIPMVPMHPADRCPVNIGGEPEKRKRGDPIHSQF